MCYTMSHNKNDEDINSRAIKRLDKDFNKILTMAKQVAVYKFSSERNEWEKKEIEGSMLIFSRSSAPHYAFVVFNRANPNNLIQLITNNLDTKLENPYLLYKNEMNEIFCIWFYDKEDCENIWRTFQAIANGKTTGVANKVHANYEHKAPNPPETVSIFSRLLNTPHTLNNEEDKLARTRQISLSENVVPNGSSGPPNTPQTLNQFIQSPQSQVQRVNQRRSVPVQDLFQSITLGNSTVEKFQSITSGNSAVEKKILAEEGQKNDVVLTPQMLDEQRAEGTRLNTQTSAPSSVLLNSPLTPSHSNIRTPIQANVFEQQLNLLEIDRVARIKPLTMEQLKQTLVHLLQNDADFLHTIHTAYLSNIQTRKN